MHQTKMVGFSIAMLVYWSVVSLKKKNPNTITSVVTVTTWTCWKKNRNGCPTCGSTTYHHKVIGGHRPGGGKRTVQRGGRQFWTTTGEVILHGTTTQVQMVGWFHQKKTDHLEILKKTFGVFEENIFNQPSSTWRLVFASVMLWKSVYFLLEAW